MKTSDPDASWLRTSHGKSRLADASLRWILGTALAFLVLMLGWGALLLFHGFPSRKLMSLPLVGKWECPGKLRYPPRFTAARLLEVSSAGSWESTEILREAQRTGVPVLVRPQHSLRAEDPRFSDFIEATEGFTLDDVGLRTLVIFDPESETWAGQRELDDKELDALWKKWEDSSVAVQLQSGAASENLSDWAQAAFAGELEDRSEPVYLKLQTRVGNPGLFKRNLTAWQDVPEALYDNLTKKRFMSSLGGYPLFPGDFVEYSQMNVQGPGARGGAHTDDPDGATYVYLRLFEGKKRIRMWPIFDEELIDAWKCAQLNWERNTTDPTSRYRSMSFDGHRWTPKGFEWGKSRDPEKTKHMIETCAKGMLAAHHRQAQDEGHRRPLKHDKLLAPLARDAGDLHFPNPGQCYVSLELQAGDELFIASGTPHQVSTQESALSSTTNYRFDTMGFEGYDLRVTATQLLSLIQGLPEADKVDPALTDALWKATLHKARGGVRLIRLADDIVSHTPFNRRLWEGVWWNGHRPVTNVGIPPGEDADLVKEVLLSLQDHPSESDSLANKILSWSPLSFLR